MDVIEAMETCSAARYLKPDPVPQDLIERVTTQPLVHRVRVTARNGILSLYAIRKQSKRSAICSPPDSKRCSRECQQPAKLLVD